MLLNIERKFKELQKKKDFLFLFALVVCLFDVTRLKAFEVFIKTYLHIALACTLKIRSLGAL